ncbi:MAG: hypothetical protein Q8L66_13845 [Caulobacter sp.]|nr:hypothetical protein [Caulobacter sp.]
MSTGTNRHCLGESLASWALREKASHFLTLQPGIFGRRFRDAEDNVLRTVGILFRDYARLRLERPKRYVVARDDLPFIVGVLERSDCFGNATPHLHCFVALELAEEPFLRGHLRRMFGADKTKGAAELPAFVRDSGPALARGMPQNVALDFPTKQRLVGHWDSHPSFDLQPLARSLEPVGRYMTKQSNDPDIITHLELYDIAYPDHPGAL